MEPCLNGTLVQADRTNKEVGPAARQVNQGWGHGLVPLTVLADSNSILIFRNSSKYWPFVEGLGTLVHRTVMKRHK